MPSGADRGPGGHPSYAATVVLSTLQLAGSRSMISARVEVEALKRVCTGFTYLRVPLFVRKWLQVLPSPFSPGDRRAGLDYDISIRQAESSRTQVFGQPRTGRILGSSSSRSS